LIILHDKDMTPPLFFELLLFDQHCQFRIVLWKARLMAESRTGRRVRAHAGTRCAAWLRLKKLTGFGRRAGARGRNQATGAAVPVREGLDDRPGLVIPVVHAYHQVV
jgi:hypothetical protein